MEEQRRTMTPNSKQRSNSGAVNAMASTTPITRRPKMRSEVQLKAQLHLARKVALICGYKAELSAGWVVVRRYSNGGIEYVERFKTEFCIHVFRKQKPLVQRHVPLLCPWIPDITGTQRSGAQGGSRVALAPYPDYCTIRTHCVPRSAGALPQRR